MEKDSKAKWLENPSQTNSWFMSNKQWRPLPKSQFNVFIIIFSCFFSILCARIVLSKVKDMLNYKFDNMNLNMYYSFPNLV